VSRRASPVAASITFGVAVGVFGVSFGVLAVTSGLSVAKTCAMSLLVFTGASQFAAVGVVGSGGSQFAAVGGALLLAARNAAYGLVMAPIVRGRLGRRLLGAQLVLDESTAMATAHTDPRDQERAFWATGLAIFAAWNVGTLVGALGGSAIGEPATLGLDAAFPAGYVVLLAPHVRTVDGKVAAVLGAAIALVFIPFTPAGVPILGAATASLVGLRRR
jgi:4-azaleucine resistance transporter AzlC